MRNMDRSIRLIIALFHLPPSDTVTVFVPPVPFLSFLFPLIPFDVLSGVYYISDLIYIPSFWPRILVMFYLLVFEEVILYPSLHSSLLIVIHCVFYSIYRCSISYCVIVLVLPVHQYKHHKYLETSFYTCRFQEQTFDDQYPFCDVHTRFANIKNSFINPRYNTNI